MLGQVWARLMHCMRYAKTLVALSPRSAGQAAQRIEEMAGEGLLQSAPHESDAGQTLECKVASLASPLLRNDWCDHGLCLAQS